MMKNQLAGLMKQAQQMQENMKKAQDELARIEVEGQAGRGTRQGRDDLPARREARDDRPVAARARTRTCSRTSSPPRSTTPCGAPRR